MAAVVQVELIGDKELERRLREMPLKMQRKVLYPSLRKGVRRMAHVIKQRLRVQTKRKTGNLLRSVGASVKTSGRKGVVMAKAGLDVGRKDSLAAAGEVVQESTHVKKRRGRHGHLLTLGTRKRWTGAKLEYSKTEKDKITGRKKVIGSEPTGHALRYRDRKSTRLNSSHSQIS